jgi:hypothetical protein
MEDILVEEVSIPMWHNRSVLVCGLSAAAKNQYQQSLVDMKNGTQKLRLENSTAKLVALTVVNRERQRLFTERDIEKLGTKSAAALECIVEVANRLSGMTKQEVDALVKNSEPSQSDDSSSVSP